MISKELRNIFENKPYDDRTYGYFHRINKDNTPKDKILNEYEFEKYWDILSHKLIK